MFKPLRNLFKESIVVKELISQENVVQYINQLCKYHDEDNQMIQNEIIDVMGGAAGVMAVKRYANLLTPIELLKLSLKDMEYYEEQMLKLSTGWPSYERRDSSFSLSNYVSSANKAHKQIELIKSAIEILQDDSDDQKTSERSTTPEKKVEI
jgi:hypothetical protein